MQAKREIRTRRGTAEVKCLECGRWSAADSDEWALSHGRKIAVHRGACYGARYVRKAAKSAKAPARKKAAQKKSPARKRTARA